MTSRWHIGAGCAALLLAAPSAHAQDVYKIGMSAGLTGYAATVDRAWRDGVEVAIAALNAKGGIAGRKIELVVEDNRSEPQEAVTVYRKMISSDKVNMFASGCVSAGNFAPRRSWCAPRRRWCCARSCRSSPITSNGRSPPSRRPASKS